MILIIAVKVLILDKEKLSLPAPGVLECRSDTEIILQPENRKFVPGSWITLSLRAKGENLRYQWYYRKPGQKKFHVWRGRTHASEAVATTQSWDGMELYCSVTDSEGNSVISDTVSVSRGETLAVLGVGDSICRGRRNDGKGFVGDLGLPYLNAGVSGASMSTVRTDVTTIPDQLAQVTGFEPDIIIAEGGLNDLYRNVPIGDIPKKQAKSVELLDISTVMGGMQKLFLIMREKYPYAQHCFLINHRIFRNGEYLVTSPNKAGYTQLDLHDAFVACCRVYGVEVIDIFEESPLDTSDFSLLCQFNYNIATDPDWENSRSNETDYVNGDGVHPLNRGYLEYYVPVIRDHILTKLGKLEIMSQPRDVTVKPGDSGAISVKARGDCLRYQWYYKKKGQEDFRKWKGRNRASEVIKPDRTWDGILFYCEVSDWRGNSVKSDTAAVTFD